MPTARRPSRFRLPADVRPTRYDLQLEPDLEGGGFRGEVRIALRLARPLAAGEATLALRFSGRLNQHLRGLYAAGADGRRYAFSQCEAADARRILPCFDEPAFKARFRLAVTVPDGLRAVSNSPIEAEHDGPDGHVIRFAPTPLLSTYLFALAVGPL